MLSQFEYKLFSMKIIVIVSQTEHDNISKVLQDKYSILNSIKFLNCKAELLWYYQIQHWIIIIILKHILVLT